MSVSLHTPFIRAAHLRLKENMVTVFYYQGSLGTLGITLTPEVYNTLSTEPWVDPAHQGAAP